MALGGKRPGAGRKPGKKLPKTLEKEKILASLRARIMRMADRILDKQLVLVNGQQFLYKIEKEWVKTGKGETTGYWRNKKPELVEDEFTIRWYLENITDKANGDIEDKEEPGETYYFITTKEPSNQAIDSMLDRTFGRSTQRLEHTGEDGNAIKITGVDIKVRE